MQRGDHHGRQYSADEDAPSEPEVGDVDILEEEDEMYGTGGPIPQAVIKDALRKMNVSAYTLI
jgi:hypothetical protein